MLLREMPPYWDCRKTRGAMTISTRATHTSEREDKDVIATAMTITSHMRAGHLMKGHQPFNH